MKLLTLLLMSVVITAASCTEQDRNIPIESYRQEICIKVYDDLSELDKAVLRSKGFTCYQRDL